MSWVDHSLDGEKIETPAAEHIDPKQSVEDTLGKFVVLLHLQGWSYRKIGKLFNRHHERMREIVTASGISTKKHRLPHFVRPSKNRPRKVD